jgi:hypothetical protein
MTPIGRPSKQKSDRVRSDGLHPLQVDALKKIAQARGVSVACIQREAVDFYLATGDTLKAYDASLDDLVSLGALFAQVLRGVPVDDRISFAVLSGADAVLPL